MSIQTFGTNSLDKLIRLVKLALDNKLTKTTYEYNTEYSCGVNGCVCIGEFPCYDTNITVSVTSGTDVTYKGTIVIGTQSYNNDADGYIEARVYDDVLNDLTPMVRIGTSSENNKVSLYMELPAWSRSLIHIQATGLKADPINIVQKVFAIPETATKLAANAVDQKFVFLPYNDYIALVNANKDDPNVFYIVTDMPNSASGNANIDIDEVLDEYSENPVQNKVIAAALKDVRKNSNVACKSADIQTLIDNGTIVDGMSFDVIDDGIQNGITSAQVSHTKADGQVTSVENILNNLGSGSGGGTGNANAKEMTETEYALHKDEYDASDDIYYFDEEETDDDENDSSILDTDIKLASTISGIRSHYVHGALRELASSAKLELQFDTREEYEAWAVSDSYDPDVTCYIKEPAVTSASNISYNNNQSGLSATNTQTAIDEVNNNLTTLASKLIYGGNAKKIEVISDATNLFQLRIWVSDTKAYALVCNSNNINLKLYDNSTWSNIWSK